MPRRRRPPPRPDDAPPRSEAEWEAEFRRMDVLTDRFGELLETLIDDPDRDAKIAREMDWFQDDEGDDDDDPELAARRDEFEHAVLQVSDAVDREMADAAEAGVDCFDDLDGDEERADRAAVPAYAAAVDVGHRVVDVLKDHPAARADDVTTDGESDAELVGRAFIGIQIAAAKLIGGHGMGYEDGVLCANIVNCKRALAGALDGRAAWGVLRARSLVTPEVADEILAAHTAVIGLIEQRIADLRSRVWW